MTQFEYYMQQAASIKNDIDKLLAEREKEAATHELTAEERRSYNMALTSMRDQYHQLLSYAQQYNWQGEDN